MAAAPSGGAPSAPPAENLPEFKAPTAESPTIQHADAGYTEQVGKLQFQLNNQLAGDKETFTNAQTTYNYNKSLYARQEPEAVGKQRFAAALGGWGNSGFEARDQGAIKANYLGKNTANLTRFQEAANKANRAAVEQTGNYNIGVAGQGRDAEERYKRLQIKNAPQEPVAPATTTGYGTAANMTSGPPAPGRTLVGTGNMGGSTPVGGFGTPGELGVIQVNGVRAGSPRETAAKKAKKR